MEYYPAFLRVAGRACLVIGGGTVALQKVRSLVDAGAQVTVISPSCVPSIATLAAAGGIRLRQRRYARGDVHGFFLVLAATNDAALHQQIRADADAANVLLNVVDDPEHCDFIMPAVLRRGDLILAASTGGASPAMAKHIRDELEQSFGPEYDLALRVLARVRTRLQASEPPERRRELLTALAGSELLDACRSGGTAGIDTLLARIVGPQVSLASLGAQL